MKKIVLESQLQVIDLHKLKGHEIVAYRCPDSSSVCVLSQVNKSMKKGWGFINLSHPQSSPTFIADTFFDAIKQVINSRKPVVFDNQDEFISAIYHKKI